MAEIGHQARQTNIVHAVEYYIVYMILHATRINADIMACQCAGAGALQVGSTLSAVLMKRYKVESYMKYVFGASAIALIVPFLVHAGGSEKKGERDLPVLPLQCRRSFSHTGSILNTSLC